VIAKQAVPEPKWHEVDPASILLRSPGAPVLRPNKSRRRKEQRRQEELGGEEEEEEVMPLRVLGGKEVRV
jgi:hypothetical protein